MATEPQTADDVQSLPLTIAELPFFASGRFPKPDALGRCEGGRIVPVGGREMLERVRDIGLGLQELGVGPGSHVALLAESRPEWLLIDFAILASAAVTVPLYPTLSVEQVAFTLRDSRASVVVVSTRAQLEKVRAASPDLPDLRAIVITSPDEAPGSDVPVGGGLPVTSLQSIEERGHQAIRQGWGVARAFHERAKAVAPDDLATIIYTSGTTGEPKGVMLTHGNLAANLRGVSQVLELTDEDVALSFLPLCHGFERLVAYVYLANGVSMIFAESVDTIGRDIKTVRPTLMTGVPRVYEKMRAKVAETAAEGGVAKRLIFQWASRVADERGALLPAGRRPGPWLALQSSVAERLVFTKIRDGIGGRMRFAVSGSAPLGESLGRWFYGIGLPLIEGYGLTETSPVLTVTPLSHIRHGSVGKALPEVELRIAPDGEVLVRGPNVMRGYYNLPDETAAALEGGWFHTGDIGTIDAEGYLRITDRKKELIVTSGGKKIAPQPIEAELRAHPLVAEAVVVGEKRHFPAVLIVPDVAAVAAAAGVGRPADEAAVVAMLARPDVLALFQQAIDAVNRPRAQYERLKKFHLLTKDLTLAAGELTPTLKVKRRVVEERYRAAINAMYR